MSSVSTRLLIKIPNFSINISKLFENLVLASVLQSYLCCCRQSPSRTDVPTFVSILLWNAVQSNLNSSIEIHMYILLGTFTECSLSFCAEGYLFFRLLIKI